MTSHVSLGATQHLHSQAAVLLCASKCDCVRIRDPKGGMRAGALHAARRRKHSGMLTMQVAEFRREAGAQARCSLCFTSGARRKGLTIAIGHTAYLALPAGCAPPPCLLYGRVAGRVHALRRLWEHLGLTCQCGLA